MMAQDRRGVRASTTAHSIQFVGSSPRRGFVLLGALHGHSMACMPSSQHRPDSQQVHDITISSPLNLAQRQHIASW